MQPAFVNHCRGSSRYGFSSLVFSCVLVPDRKSKNKSGSLGFGIEIRLRLAGVNPNSDAIRIIISTFLFAIETEGDWIGLLPEGDFTMVPLLDGVASAHKAPCPIALVAGFTSRPDRARVNPWWRSNMSTIARWVSNSARL